MKAIRVGDILAVEAKTHCMCLSRSDEFIQCTNLNRSSESTIGCLFYLARHTVYRSHRFERTEAIPTRLCDSVPTALQYIHNYLGLYSSSTRHSISLIIIALQM